MDDARLRRTPPNASRTVGIFVAFFYALLFLALVWPVYPIFATIEPRVLAMPFSLVYVVVCLLLSFFALFGFYLWERRREPAAGAGSGSDGTGAEAGGGG